ncbi:MAG: MtrB/PioB family decaheme-associated outer membrane protein [Betaproteobacteria bacterium]|jgi:MtrB/PioB family decaheme-associated outer membrane protein|nr:MtrB/PioB family decaheme-associated outer membrane protein [Betaproteobacteria bacterium]
MSKIDRAKRDLSFKPLGAIAGVVALALAAPGAALAEPMFQVPLTRGADMTRYDSNYFELGGGFQSQDSFKFGEFSGLYKEGGFVIGNFNMRKRFGDAGNYVNAFGYNLGQDSRQLGIEGGRQGRYWLDAGFQQLTRYQYSDTQFIHAGLGGSSLVLPAGCGGFGQPPTATTAQLDACLHTYEIKQKREIGTLGGGFYAGNWKFSLDYRQDDQTGNKRIGAVMGSNGGNPRSAILPYELDGKTTQITARANWTTKQAQADISFWYSKYDNNANSLTWQNPYTAAGGWAAGTGFPTGYGRLGLMPDNDFWQLQGTGAWNITPTMRLTGTLSYGVMSQNEAFLPYTINTAQIPITTPLPRASADAQIKNTLFDLTYTWRALSKLSLKANYHYRKQDNNTPQAQYGYVAGDVGAQPNPVADTTNNGAIRVNLPPGTVENKFKIDADYSLMRGTLLRGWYQYTRVNYEIASEELRSDTSNNQFAVELRKIMSEQFTGWLRYTYDQRRGSDFSTTRPYAASYTSATVAASPVDNLTTTRQFFMADYDKNLFTAVGNFSPMPKLSLGARFDWYETKFKGPDCGGPGDQVAPGFTFPPECQGRDSMNGSSFTLDGSYTPALGWNTFAFYTYQTYKTDQTSRSWSGGNLAQATDPARDWTASIKQNDNTFGLGVKYQPPGKQWDAGATYIYSSGKGTYDLGAGTVIANPVQPVPTNEAKGQSLQLYAKYQASKNILLRFNYWYQSLRSNDWAYDYATPSSSSNVLLTGHQSPRYTENVFGVSIAYTGW